MTPLDDAFLKIERGKEQLEEFYRHVKVVFDAQEVSVKIRRNVLSSPPTDTRKHVQFTLYASNVPVVSKKQGIILGQAIQCFRSSLDYLAWALVGKYGRQILNDEQIRKIKFPVSYKPSTWNKTVRNSLPNVPQFQQAFFEAYQPYKRSSSGRTMKHLNVLSNMEKHKIIIPTGMWPETGEIGFWFSDFDDKVIDSKKQYRIGSQIRVGTNIFTVVIASEDPKVQARTHFKVYPVFPRTIVKPPSGQPAIPAQEVTDNISKVYTEMLNQAAKFF